MNLAMMSIRRPGGREYAYQSILSLLAGVGFAGRLHVFLGNADASHLGFLAGSPRVTLHPMAEGEWLGIAELELARRQSYAAWKAMSHFAERGEDLCLCEDDVLFDPEFWPRLGSAVAELDDARRDYVLTAYAYDDFAADPGLERRRWTARYPAGAFWGAQAVYFPAATLPDFTAFVREHGVDRDGPPTDLLYRVLADQRDCLYLTNRSLVQHLGVDSAAGSPFHTSPTFGRPWPPPP